MRITDMNTAQVKEELHHLWGELLPSKSFDEDSDFLSVGGSSLKVMSLFVKCMKKFGVKMEVKNFYALNTINRQSAFITSELQLEAQLE